MGVFFSVLILWSIRNTQVLRRKNPSWDIVLINRWIIWNRRDNRLNNAVIQAESLLSVILAVFEYHYT